MARAIQSMRQHWVAVSFTLGLAIVVVLAAVTYGAWSPWVAGLLADMTSLVHTDAHDHADAPAEDGHDDAESGHPGHSEVTSIELSPNGLKNIGYEPLTVAVGTFVKTVTMPAVVVERPGRSQIQITAPLTGVITKIHPIEGAAVAPDSPMFEVRLTHEELVAAQRDLVRTAEGLDVVNREIARLKSLGDEIVAGRRILEQEYERQKLQASLQAERQALLFHGLSHQQIEAIVRDRELLQRLTVRAPAHDDENEPCRDDHLFHVQQLPVKLGQQIEAGQVLCVLADYCELYVEGRAFADDAERLRKAARDGWPVPATLLAGDRHAGRIEGLKLLYLADHVDPESRAFRFYLSLPNEVALDQTGPHGNRFIEWRFKPGQRMELQVPVERWEDRIVLPVEAVIDEGAENYVYQQNGDHFDRVPVHVEYRNQSSVVVANDGAVLPGDVIAGRGAYQMHLALKNKSGGGGDPHAGHNH